MHGKGIADPSLRIDWPSLMRFKRGFTDPVGQMQEVEYWAVLACLLCPVIATEQRQPSLRPS